MQRVYGVAFASRKRFANILIYARRRAKKRDHRKPGQEPAYLSSGDGRPGYSDVYTGQVEQVFARDEIAAFSNELDFSAMASKVSDATHITKKDDKRRKRSLGEVW